MTEWTSGYVSDVEYTFGYYGELNPARAKLPFLSSGLAFPEVSVACELGYGQGLSVNIHAAGSRTTWFGTDFNPSQSAFAREAAGIAGAGAQLFDQSFLEFCSRDDLPQFDFIGMHGIWSWISKENQEVIIDFLRRKLAVGGVLFISYNTYPGWTTTVPLRHLLADYASSMVSPKMGSLGQIHSALDFATQLQATNPAFWRANPQVGERLKLLMSQNPHYLAHEYFNQNWSPIHFSDMARCLTEAKLSFACSAYSLDLVDPINLTNEQQAFLKQIPDPSFRQGVRDFMVNQQFRRDYWVKGPRHLSGLEQAECLRDLRVLLIPKSEADLFKVKGALGEAVLQEPVYRPIIDALAGKKVKTVGELEGELGGRGISLSHLREALLVLEGKGDLVLVQDEANISSTREQARKLNHHLMNRARADGDIGFLASPVTGGGVLVGRFQQLFLMAMSSGRETPMDWVDYVWQLLSVQGQTLAKDGQALMGADANREELMAMATLFAEEQLPILRSLGID